MNIFNNIRNYIGEDEFKLIIYSDKINIINYNKINEITNKKVIIQNDKIITIEGKNLETIKILNNELLIKGIINSIIINE